MRLGTPALILCLLATAAARSKADDAYRWEPNPVVVSVSEKVVAPFLMQHCVTCHGQEKQNGQIRFDKPV